MTLSNSPTLGILWFVRFVVNPHPRERSTSQIPWVCPAPLPWGLTLTSAFMEWPNILNLCFTCNLCNGLPMRQRPKKKRKYSWCHYMLLFLTSQPLDAKNSQLLFVDPLFDIGTYHKLVYPKDNNCCGKFVVIRSKHKAVLSCHWS